MVKHEPELHNQGPGIYKVLTDSRLGQKHAATAAIAVPLGITPGAAYRNRTDDLRITSASLCRLS
jgi:hypothetical protein